MSEKVKITSLEIENVKRVQAVSLTVAENGLTTLGGDNFQGKSSCLDTIMSVLGGEKFTPSDPVHTGADKGHGVVALSNGMTVSRTYTKNGTYLKVDAPSKSNKTGQSLINEFISAFALDLSTFLTAPEKKKAEIVLKIIGVDLAPFNEKLVKLEADRLIAGRLEIKAKGHAESMPYDEAAGNELLSPTDIMEELEKKVQINAGNRERRDNAEKLNDKSEALASVLKQREKRMKEVEAALEEATQEYRTKQNEFAEASIEASQAVASLTQLIDADTTVLKQELADIDDKNARIRMNFEREKAFTEVKEHHGEYLSIQSQVESVRDEKQALLNGASMPLEDLEVQNDVLTYKGQAWDGMSHAEQLMVTTAICRAVNPKMGFVLIDNLESMDIKTLGKFGAWLKAEDLQAITTRVSQGDECSVIIEDGLIAEKKEQKQIQF